MPLTEGLPGSVMREGRSIIVADLATVDAPSALERAWLDVGFRSMLVVPVRSAAEPLGALVFARVTPSGFGPEDREIADLQFFRDLDAKLWKKGRPHVLETFEVDRLAKNALRGGPRDPLDPVRWLERASRMYRRPPFDRKDEDQ